jgi:tripartite-type tricarboxylate transporter receptor subunit TctC
LSLSEHESGVWFGLLTPAGTLKDAIARVNEAANKGLKSIEG